jgi:hypothetical protein
MVSVKVFELVRSKEKSKKAEFEIEEMLKSILVSYRRTPDLLKGNGNKDIKNVYMVIEILYMTMRKKDRANACSKPIDIFNHTY